MENSDCNFQNACSVCLCEKENMVSLSAKSDTSDSLEYGTLLKICTNSLEYDELNLFTLICIQCTRDLQTTFQFHLKIRKRNDKLKAFLNEVKTQKDVDDDDVCNDDDDDDNMSIKSEPLNLKEEIIAFQEIEVIPVDAIKIEVKEEEEIGEDIFDLGRPRKSKSRSRRLRGSLASLKLMKNMFKCDFCEKTFKNQSTLILHRRCHTKERPFKCSKCDKAFGAKGTLSKHFHSFHMDAERNFFCEYCPKRFLKKNDLKIHVRTHTGEAPYSCKYCSRSFAQSGTMRSHEKTHTGERPFFCKLCKKTFPSKQRLKRHSVSHSDKRDFTCDLCGLALKSKPILKNHMISMHTDHKNHVCEICGMKYAMRSGLLTHKRFRHSEKSGICDICRKSVSDLEEHTRLVHTHKRTYQCDVCKRFFLRKRNLSTHIILTHSENFRHKCTYEGCSKMFPRQYMLDFHVRKYHTHVSPFQCTHCDHSCFRSSDLVKHLKMKHHIKT